MGWLPIRSGEWTLTYEQTYCSCTKPAASGATASLNFEMKLVYFFLPLNGRKTHVFQVPLQPVLCKMLGVLVVCTWYLGGKASPAELRSVDAPPASPINQYCLSVLNSVGAGQPWTWIMTVLNRAGLTRHSISRHPRAAGLTSVTARDSYISDLSVTLSELPFPSISSPSYHSPHRASQKSPVPSKTPNFLYFMKQPVAFKPAARKDVD